MTYNELLAKFENWGVEHPYVQPWKNALFAVVELHKPVIVLTDVPVCSHCESDNLTDPDGAVRSYPCPTIQAIEKELQ